MSNSNDKYDFGMIGLGTMGRNLLLNMGDHGVKGAGFDKDASKGKLLEQESHRGANCKDAEESFKSHCRTVLIQRAGAIWYDNGVKNREFAA